MGNIKLTEKEPLSNVNKLLETSKKRQEKSNRREIIASYIIGLVLIFLMLLQIGKTVYRHTSEYYKPIYYIIDTLKMSSKTDFSVKIDKKEKTVEYVFEEPITWYGTTITGVFTDYLSENPDNILNQDYKISFTFSDHDHRDYYYVGSICNFYHDEIHKDFDTIIHKSFSGFYNVIGFKSENIKYAYYYNGYDPNYGDFDYDNYVLNSLLSYDNLIEANIDIHPDEFEEIYNIIKEKKPELILHNTYEKK